MSYFQFYVAMREGGKIIVSCSVQTKGATLPYCYRFILSCGSICIHSEALCLHLMIEQVGGGRAEREREREEQAKC